MQQQLTRDSMIKLFKAVKHPVTQGSVNTLVSNFHFILHRCFVFRFCHACCQQGDIVMQCPLLQHICKYRLIATGFGYDLLHVIGFEAERNAAKIVHTVIEAFDNLGNGCIGERQGMGVFTERKYVNKHRAWDHFSGRPVRIAHLISCKISHHHGCRRMNQMHAGLGYSSSFFQQDAELGVPVRILILLSVFFPKQ